MTSFYNCSVEPIDNFNSTNDIIANSTVIEMIDETSAQADPCEGANPRARIINNGSVPFDYTIHDSAGSLIAGIYNVLPGMTSDWTVFSEGTVYFQCRKMVVDRDQKVCTSNGDL